MQDNQSKIQSSQKITPFLWFDNNAEEAVNFYVSVFNNSQIRSTVRYNAEGAKTAGLPEGAVMTMEFTLDGQPFSALNGGPIYKFTEAISFAISCDGQEEVDKFWNQLTANGGTESRCGWLKDRFGLSWQVVPSALMRLLKDSDGAKAKRVMHAMLQMKKIIIADLEKAANGN